MFPERPRALRSLPVPFRVEGEGASRTPRVPPVTRRPEAPPHTSIAKPGELEPQNAWAVAKETARVIPGSRARLLCAVARKQARGTAGNCAEAGPSGSFKRKCAQTPPHVGGEKEAGFAGPATLAYRQPFGACFLNDLARGLETPHNPRSLRH